MRDNENQRRKFYRELTLIKIFLLFIPPQNYHGGIFLHRNAIRADE